MIWYNYYQLDSGARAPLEDKDKFIFQLFNLSHKENLATSEPITKRTITKEEICVMLCNLPHVAVIKSKGSEGGIGSGIKKLKQSSIAFGNLAASSASLAEFGD